MWSIFMTYEWMLISALGNNVLMAKLRVLDSLGMQSGLNNMRFVDIFLSLQTNSSQISYQIVCLRLTGSDAPPQTYIKVYCYVLYLYITE